MVHFNYLKPCHSPPEGFQPYEDGENDTTKLVQLQQHTDPTKPEVDIEWLDPPVADLVQESASTTRATQLQEDIDDEQPPTRAKRFWLRDFVRTVCS